MHCFQLFSRRRVRPLLLGLGLSCLLPACQDHTVVLVRDTDETAFVGRKLGGYRYPSASTLGDKDATLRASGSPQRLPTRVSDVRTGEVVTAQTVGAYVDPANPQLLHQPHVVYRVDQSSRFRLAPASDAPLRTGPVAGLRRREYSPNASAGEVGREIMSSRRAVERAADTIQKVEGQQVALAADTNRSNQELMDNQTKLLGLVKKQNERLEAVETRQAQLQTLPSSGARYPLGSSGSATATPAGDGRQSNPPITSQQPVGSVPASATSTRSGMVEN